MKSSRCDKHSGADPWLGPLESILCLLRDGSVAEALGTSGPEVPGPAQVSSRGKKTPGCPHDPQGVHQGPQGAYGIFGGALISKTLEIARDVWGHSLCKLYRV